MSTGPVAVAEKPDSLFQRVADYVELTKPKIAILLLACVAVSGILAAGGQPDVIRLINVIVGTALVAASSCVWNQCLEARFDRMMPRTASRPIASGRISCSHSAVFGTLLGSIGVSYLAATVGLLPAAFGMVTWVLYVFIYTPLKQVTPWNTTIGAIAGALPIFMGWLAINSELSMSALALFAILFFWQFPHFMAIAWLYRRDYAKGGMRMWSVVDESGIKAGMQAVSGALSLLLVSLIPGLNILAWPQALYLLFTLMMGVLLLAASIRFLSLRTDRSARTLLFASLIYLPIQFGLLFLLPATY